MSLQNIALQCGSMNEYFVQQTACYAGRLSSMFQDLFINPHHKEEGMDPNALPDVLIAHVCSFLSLSDLGNLAQTCKSMQRLLDVVGNQEAAVVALFYAKHFAEFGSEVKTFAQYLEERLVYERNELEHFTATLPLITALQRAGLGGGAGEISGNIGKFPTREIAQAVSRRRPQALCGVLVDDLASAALLRQRLTSLPTGVSFLITSAPDSFKPARPRITSKGFIGYALELLQLREEEEEYRETVLSAFVYRDLTVWESMEDVQYAMASGAYPQSGFYCVLRGDAGNQATTAATMSCTWAKFRPKWDNIANLERVQQRIARSIAVLERAQRFKL